MGGLMLLFSVLLFGAVNSMINDCGLNMEVFLNNEMAAYIRCTDTTGNSNPTWRVNNISDYQHQGLAELRLFGVSFTVLSLQWSSLPQRQATVECRSEPSVSVDECRLVTVVRKEGTPQPRELTTERTTTTTARTLATTTKRRGAFFFPGERPSTGAPRNQRPVCVAVGQFRGRRGMNQWCMDNCNSMPRNCPTGVCSCASQQPR
eukprot:TRINITY_DN47825_c0_g1_i1.p1 TRINITY_DN47825_c0_g1~~TRINITY_DN47825_c0_g1_i1.p1  ORF type:complete len:205 (+),score=39.85 TRINITY_DN47825_c0_g1_i1:34-648(+)